MRATRLHEKHYFFEPQRPQRRQTLEPQINADGRRFKCLFTTKAPVCVRVRTGRQRAQRKTTTAKDLFLPHRSRRETFVGATRWCAQNQKTTIQLQMKAFPLLTFLPFPPGRRPPPLLLQLQQGDFISRTQPHRRTPRVRAGGDVDSGISSCVQPLHELIPQPYDKIERKYLACMGVS